MTNVKLTGANRFIGTSCGIREVIERGAVVEVTEIQAEYLVSLTKKDRSNNIHNLFIVTDESPDEAAETLMNKQQKLAAAVRREKAELDASEPEEVEAPIKRRRPKKGGAKGIRTDDALVA